MTAALLALALLTVSVEAARHADLIAKEIHRWRTR